MENKFMPGMLIRSVLFPASGNFRIFEVEVENESRVILHCVQHWPERFSGDYGVDIRKFYPDSQELEAIKEDFATALCLEELKARSYSPSGKR